MVYTDGLLLFHQGWTDILNSLALITLYAPRYETLHIIARTEAAVFVNFYCRFLDNVHVICLPKTMINDIFAFYWAQQHDTLARIQSILALDTDSTDLLFHGSSDVHRRDDYKDAYHNACTGGMFFVDAFYTPYGLDPSLRISHFTVERDHNREQEFYTAFYKKHGEKYHLTHGIHTDNPHAVELGNTTETFFDAIQVLEHAQSMTLIDSVWAALVYLLQAKYGLFSKTPITIVSRGHGYEGMFYQPVRFSNWSFLNPSQ